MGSNGGGYDPEVVLSVRGLKKWFATGTCILSGIEFDVARGEFITLIGPSGCGKSTLISCIAGLEPVSEGEVLLNGRRVDAPTPECGVVFQEYALFPWMTVYQNVEYGLRMQQIGDREQRRERVLRYLELVKLQNFLTYYPSQLSGGMRQRLAIARALVVQPKILLMDEPFAAVDAFTRRNLQEELLAIWEKTRMTVVFITHNLQEAVLMGDRIVCLSRMPTEVKDIITVEAPRPRNVDVPDHPGVSGAMIRVQQVLREEVQGVAGKATVAEGQP